MPKSSKRKGRPQGLIFEARNYVLFFVGVLLIVVGFTAMYLENAFEGFISLYVSPILIVGGYAEIVYALLWWPDEEDDLNEEGGPRS